MAFQIDSIPENNRGHDQAQAIGSMLLILVSTVPEFAETIKEDCASQSVARRTLSDVSSSPGRCGGNINAVFPARKLFTAKNRFLKGPEVGAVLCSQFLHLGRKHR
jgi:hypothetical protein